MARRIEVKGLRELNRALNRLDEHTRAGVLDEVLQESAKPIRDEARHRGGAVWDELATGIHIYKGDRGPDFNSVVIAEHKDLFQAWWFEFGTSYRYRESGAPTGKMERRPFMRPALDTKAKEALKVFKRELKRRLRRAV